MANAPARPAPPPPIAKNGKSPAQAAPREKRDVVVSSGIQTGAERIAIYGPGGAGKSTLAALLTEVGIKPLFIDLDDGSQRLPVDRVSPIESFDELRDLLHNEELCSQYGAIVIDSLTKAEELASAWCVENIPHEKGHRVKSIEGYGFGKGMGHIYDSMLHVFGDLDAHIRRGRHVVVICHECVSNVPNPAGEDWIRYEPRLQSPKSGKDSVRHKLKEWAAHLLFVGFDASVSEDGKGTGAGTRTIYTSELPCWWAKSRQLSDPVPYEKNSAELWRRLFNKGE